MEFTSAESSWYLSISLPTKLLPALLRLLTRFRNTQCWLHAFYGHVHLFFWKMTSLFFFIYIETVLIRTCTLPKNRWKCFPECIIVLNIYDYQWSFTNGYVFKMFIECTIVQYLQNAKSTVTHRFLFEEAKPIFHGGLIAYLLVTLCIL